MVHDDPSISVPSPPSFTTERKNGASVSKATLAYIATTNRRHHPVVAYKFGTATLASKPVFTSREDYKRQRVGAPGQTRPHRRGIGMYITPHVHVH